MTASPDEKAPIALFAYDRPVHLRRTVEALLRNPGFERSRLFVFVDGPRDGAAEPRVSEVRAYVRSLGVGNLEMIESPRNRGIAGSIRDGVTRLTEEFGRVIVLEDDLVTSPGFLRYMNAALERYEAEQGVWQVCAGLQRARVPSATGAFFAPMASSWGWGTWQRSWKEFMRKTDAGTDELRRSWTLRRRFDQGSRFPFYYMLRQSERGRSDSWAIWFQWRMFQANGVALWPPAALVRNIGFDGSGVHSRLLRDHRVAPQEETSSREDDRFPERIEVEPSLWREVLSMLLMQQPWWYRGFCWSTELFA